MFNDEKSRCDSHQRSCGSHKHEEIKELHFSDLVRLKKSQQVMSRQNEGFFRILQGQITLIMTQHWF